MTTQALVDDLRRIAFTPRRELNGPPKIGAEVEVIPVRASTRRVVPIHEMVPVLRALGRRGGWTERPSPYGAPIFSVDGVGNLSFEPGGQIELSAAPCRSVSALLAEIRCVMDPLGAAAADAGMELLSVGIDPVNQVECVPLQLPGQRYVAMDEYLATRGTNGARMMRQTAALQVSLDVGADPVAEWRVLSALAPYVIAIFANSPRYAEESTGHQSFRAHVWRTLDRARTGLPAATADDPAAEYCAFALAAPAILCRDRDGAFRPFGELLAAGDATAEDWPVHLTTLFPEIRPRGTFEVRSADAIPTEWHAAPLTFLAGLLYDPRAFAEARALLGDADPPLLVRAGQCGLHDPVIAPVAQDLVTLALEGAQRLGPTYVTPSDLEIAKEFFDRYTSRGRSPADG